LNQTGTSVMKKMSFLVEVMKIILFLKKKNLMCFH